MPAKKPTEPSEPAFPEDLTSITDAELTDLEASLRSRYEAARAGEISTETLAGLQQIAEQIEAIRTENTRRAEVRAEMEATLAEIDQRVAEPVAEEPEPAPEPEPDPELEPTEATATATEAAAPPAPPAPALAAAASSTTTATVRVPPANRITVPARQRPLAPPRPRLSITAAADVPGFSAGSRFDDPRLVGEAFANRAEALMRAGARGVPAPIASFGVDWPAERMLDRRDTAGNSAKIEGVIGPDALVAAGGLCAPVDVSYDLATVATTDRPVRDALARFGADRGGIRLIRPPQLSDLAAGVRVWTEATDKTPGSETKACVTISCGTETEVLVDAIPLCIEVGNFSRRTFPEQFEAWYQLGLAQQARVAENRLLTLIGTASTAVTDGQNLGAARDILETLMRAGAGARNSHRMAADAPLQVLLPAWARDAIRADLVRAPADSPDAIVAADSIISGYFATANLRPTWYLDGETGAGQIFAAQGAGALIGWPTTVVGYLFPPGSFLHLDGGTLDLGVEIRDSSLNSTNDVQAFIETFESVAFTGVWSEKITMSICVSGHAAAPATFTCSLGS